MELYLLWKGPHSSGLILELYRYLNNTIPEYEKIIKNIDDNRLFSLARNLEEYLVTILSNFENITIIDNQIYYIGDINNLKIDIILRSATDLIFPHNFFMIEHFNIKTLNIDQDELIEIIKLELESNLSFNLNIEISDDWEKKIVNIYVKKDKVLVSKFEKTTLGNFLYLLFLRDKFIDNPNVCVIITDLIPLINKAKEIEKNLIILSEDDFQKKYPSYANIYQILLRGYRNDKISIFRLNLLYNIIQTASPYIVSKKDINTGKIEVNISNTFKILLDRCYKTKSRFIVSFVVLLIGDSGHANILIIDKEDDSIERFEPNGYIFYEDEDYKDLVVALDEKLITFFKEYGYKYFSPKDFCPKIGIQLVETAFSKNIGFCVSWSIIYSIERLQSMTSRTYIAENLLQNILAKYKLHGKSSTETYANLEKWLENTINSIFSSLDKYYKQLSELLGINITYSKSMKDESFEACLIWKS